MGFHGKIIIDQQVYMLPEPEIIHEHRIMHLAKKEDGRIT